MATVSNKVTIQIADEIIVLTGDDLIAFEADRAAQIAYKESLKAAATAADKAKAEAKATAEAKLTALGLTADDLKALGLGNN
jgi:hypothetical protein